MPPDYDASRRALFYPGRATDFFRRGAPPNAAALAAEVSRLVYSHDTGLIARALASVGLAKLAFFPRDRFAGRGTQALLAEGEDRAVLAFRGTEAGDPLDLIADADVFPAKWPSGGRVHRGFARALRAVWPAIEERLGHLEAPRLLITGHSLGAALAVLAASLQQACELYAFGAPRVGDAAFAARFDGIAVHRVVNCCDLVCRVPPRHIVPWCRFAHVGAPVYLDRDGAVCVAPEPAAIAEDRRYARAEYPYSWRGGKVGLRDLADHAPVNYVSPLWAAGAAGLTPR